MESRRLDLSDLASEQEIEIKKNPYRFLDLPIEANMEDVKKAYRQIAKDYHPDLVNQSWDTDKIRRLYTQQDIDSLNLKLTLEELLLGVNTLTEYSKKVGSIITKNLKSLQKQKIPEPSQKLKNSSRKISEVLASLATKKMTLLNRAYYEIKARANPKEWNRLFGYDAETIFDEKQGEINLIKLDGRGEVWIFPKDDDFFVKGAYLSFDFGPDDTHTWEPWDYRHSLYLKHLFAHMEHKEEKTINKNLLQPLAECFNFDEKQTKTLIELLSSEDIGCYGIMEKIGIKQPTEIKDFDDQIRSMRFERQINEILHLSRNLGPIWYDKVHAEVKDEKLVLEDYTKTTFSETDYMLFSTLAYGQLIQ